MADTSPVLFISYSHDSDEHRERVLGLSERLRQDGFETVLDRYVNGAPSEGWPRWMLNQLKTATFVLLVCTETYYRRFSGDEEPGKGKGVDWEGALIDQALYDARSNTLKFVPILFEAADEAFIPEPLRSITHYALVSEERYQELVDFLRGVAGIEPGPIGPVISKARPVGSPLIFGKPKPKTKKKIAASKLPTGAGLLIGRDQELKVLDRALKSEDTRIIEFVAWGGVGKSALVVEWMARIARKWTGIDRYFDWSFYSQGTRDQSAVSSDQFIAQALSFFGDPDPTLGSPHERGNRLAELVAEQPTVLILDGLEPLQYGTGPLKGQLKDPAVLALLKGLAQRLLTGLCVLTTREVLTDLQSFHNKSVIHHPLEQLSNTAGAALLHQSGAIRQGASNIKANDKELKITSDEVKGHALTLRLLGGYLKLAQDGDINRRDRVAFEKADEEIQGGHAFRTISAYEVWLEAPVVAGRGGDPKKGLRQISMLRLLGLFDRPASAECLKALRQAPTIARLTEQLVGLDEENWNIAVTSLEELDLISNQNGTLDAHPLVREYFANQLREKQNKAWTEGHRRLFEHLCEITEHRPDTIEGLQPLYQAVAHGCQAGLYQQAREDVYRDRILRGTGIDGFYSMRKLGAFGADLGALACFFDPPWHRVTLKLSATDQAFVLSLAAYALRALGRLTEALEPMRAGQEIVHQAGGLEDRRASWQQPERAGVNAR